MTGVPLAAADPADLGFAPERLARVSELVERYVDAGRLAGAVTLVARRGRVAHLEAHGARDLASGAPMEVGTLFRIYSMTKIVTSVAALMLVEEGRLGLADPVAAYVPAFADVRVAEGMGPLGPRLARPRRPMTVHDLLRHTAGLSYGWFADSPVEELYRRAELVREERTLAEFVDALAELPLLYHPGEGWRYSYATDVLGRVVEVVAGAPLERVFRERIFGPLGMTETRFHLPGAELERLATLYSPFEGFELGGAPGRTPDEPALHPVWAPTGGAYPAGFHSGGGGLVGSAGDYLRFASALLGGGAWNGARLLGRRTVALMTRDHVPPELHPLVIGEDELAGHGFGLGVAVHADPARSGALAPVGAYGWGGAASTDCWIDPTEELVLLFMTQLVPSSSTRVVDEFRTAVYAALVD